MGQLSSFLPGGYLSISCLLICVLFITATKLSISFICCVPNSAHSSDRPSRPSYELLPIVDIILAGLFKVISELFLGSHVSVKSCLL